MNSGLLQLWKDDFLLFLISQFALVSIFIYFFNILLFWKKIFFSVDHFYGLYWICYNIASVLWFWFLFFWPWGMWYLSSPARDRTCIPYVGRWILNHWTTWEVPIRYFHAIKKKCLILKSKSYENQQSVECLMMIIVTGSTTVQWTNDLLN